MLQALPVTPEHAQQELLFHLALGSHRLQAEGMGAWKCNTPIPGPASCVSKWARQHSLPRFCGDL